MNCDDFRAAFLAGDLDDGHFAHLSGCEACRAEQRHLAGAAEQLIDPDVWVEPRPNLVEEVVVAVGAAGSPLSRRLIRWVAAAAAVIVVAAAGFAYRALTPGPDWTVALQPTERAPGAAASVRGWNTESGTRLAIEASGLDPAPEGFVYELWFSFEDRHVSAGTFAAVDDVSGWVGVRRGDFPRVWITLEALDSDAGPSRTTVLDTVRR